MPNRFQVLFESSIEVFLLVVQKVCMLFANFSVYFSGKLSLNCDSLCFFKHCFLEKQLNLDVVLQLCQLVHSKSPVFLLDKHLNRLCSQTKILVSWFPLFCLNLHLQNLQIACVEQRKLIIEIVNLNFIVVFLGLDFNHIIVEKFYHVFLSF